MMVLGPHAEFFARSHLAGDVYGGGRVFAYPYYRQTRLERKSFDRRTHFDLDGLGDFLAVQNFSCHSPAILQKFREIVIDAGVSSPREYCFGRKIAGSVAGFGLFMGRPN